MKNFLVTSQVVTRVKMSPTLIGETCWGMGPGFSTMSAVKVHSLRGTILADGIWGSCRKTPCYVGEAGLESSQRCTTCPAVSLSMEPQSIISLLKQVRRHTASKWGMILTPKSRPVLSNMIVMCHMQTVQNISIIAKMSISQCWHTVHKNCEVEKVLLLFN